MGQPATPVRALPWLHAPSAAFITGALASLSFAYWAWDALARWHAFHSGAFDLAFFDQIIWNTAQGRPFATSFVAYNFLGQHVEPALLLFIPGYWLGGGPLLLVLVQQIAANLAALPLYRAARATGLPAPLSVALAGAYLLNPYLHRALAFDFHPEVIAALPAFAAATAIAGERTRVGVALACSVLLFKEDAAFIVLTLAGWAWWRGAPRIAVALTAVAVVWTVVTVLVVMPAIRGDEPSDLVARYPIVDARSFGEMLAALPGIAAAQAGGAFVGASLVPALASPFTALWAAPGLALALFSTHPQQQTLALHYAAEIVPVAMLASVVGAHVLRRRCGDRATETIVVVPVLLVALFASPVASPPSGRDVPPERRAALEAAVALVPPDASVSVQSGLAARLSQRRTISEFPGGWEDAQWIVLDAAGYRTTQVDDAGYGRAAAEARRQRQVVFEREGVVVLTREVSP